MELVTSRFGLVEFETDEIITFERGLFGFETAHQWLLFADAHHPLLSWLQSLARPDIALPVASPYEITPGYRLSVPAREMADFSCNSRSLMVLVELTRHCESVTVNLTLPIIVDWSRRLGRQVVMSGNQAVQCAMSKQVVPLRQSA